MFLVSGIESKQGQLGVNLGSTCTATPLVPNDSTSRPSAVAPAPNALIMLSPEPAAHGRYPQLHNFITAQPLSHHCVPLTTQVISPSPVISVLQGALKLSGGEWGGVVCGCGSVPWRQGCRRAVRATPPRPASRCQQWRPGAAAGVAWRRTAGPRLRTTRG